jgi:hypothetical protein
VGGRPRRTARLASPCPVPAVILMRLAQTAEVSAIYLTPETVGARV